MSEDKPDESLVRCSCGIEIGRYVVVGEQVWLQIGSIKTRSIVGVCDCGKEFYWTFTKKKLDDLLERMRRNEKASQ